MERIAEFEKVSFEQYLKDAYEIFDLKKVAETAKMKEEEMNLVQKLIYKDIKIPVRSTSGSAGYDFCSTQNFVLQPGQSITLPTGIKCRIAPGWVLMMFPRSSLGFKYRAVLANTVGIIDSDYYGNPDNEGHMRIKICNDGDKEMEIKEGDRIAQGIFIPFGITESDNVTESRNGGFGSTGK